MKAMCAIIWDDGRQHFKEVPTYDLGPLRDVGFDVLRVSNDAVEKIILNMVEFRNVGENFPTRY
ncbi:MAG: hypothetical protein LBB18_01105 [Puniceicoccales bacterium]|jgi:very-short-patch-repair endonuclease|nr:hypothetical protein [Puniceicoccales bacterium]